MKRIFLIIAMLWSVAQAQTIGYFRYDSTRFEKVGGNNELIILNGTRGVTGGVLTNTGNGRTAFVAPAMPVAGWRLTGNSGTSAGTNFIGTTDSVDLVGKTNNLERFRWNARGALGLGTGTDYGTSGYVLKSNGSGSAPAWVATSSFTPTWDETLVAGSTLLQSHVIDMDGNTFTWSNRAGNFFEGTIPVVIGDVSLSGNDSNLTVINGIWGKRGVRFSGLPQSASTSDSVIVKTSTGELKTRAQSAVGTSTNLANSDLTQSNVDRTYTIPNNRSLTFFGNNAGILFDINSGNFDVEGNVLNLEGTTRVYATTENTFSGEFTGVDFYDASARLYTNDSLLIMGADTAGAVKVTIPSTGVATFDARGSAPGFVFSDKVGIGTTPTAELDVLSTATTGTGLNLASSTITTGALATFTNTGTAAASNTKKVLSIISSGANATSSQTVTGQTISVTNTGTTNTNVGLNVTATGGSTDNNAIIATAGNGNVLTVNTNSQISGIRWGSAPISGSSRSWGIYTNYAAYSDMVFRYSSAQGTDPYSTGGTALYLSNSGNVGAGGTTATSTLTSNGSFATAYRAITALRTLDATDHTINCTSGTFTVTLPTAASITGRQYVIVNSGSGTITIGTTSSQTFVNINGTPTTLTLAPVGAAAITSYTVVSNGANWIVTAKVKDE